MSSDPVIDDEQAAEAKREALIEEARETKAELDAAQEAALDQIADEGDLESYATVELGDLELEVKAWLPGDVEKTVSRAQRVARDEDAEAIRESMATMLDALTAMTTADQYNDEFWQQYYDRYGPSGLIVAVETILGPASEDLQAKQEAVDGFREDGPRPEPGTGRGTDR